MDKPSASVRELAKRLLAVEAAATDAARAHEMVWEKLRISLTRLAGTEGFASLLRRAGTLARAEVPSLKDVTLKPDGSLQGLEADAAGSKSRGSDATVAITAHLLGLLVTFVGESLMLRLVREAWPDAPAGD